MFCGRIVDENLFYKGVDKKKVHGARLHQTHSLAEPETAIPTPGEDQQDHVSAEHDEHPPYPFDSGNSLLALTKKHNVRGSTSSGVRRCQADCK